jgi:YD repeat-containing protein
MRVTAAAVLLALVASTGVVAAPPASAVELAQFARQRVLDLVRAAAADHDHDHYHDESDAAPSDAPVPSAEASLSPGQESTLASESLGVSAVFSGYDLTAPVTLTLGEPAASTAARRSAVSETDGTPISDVVEIDATNANGDLVHEFPAELIDIPGDGTPENPTVKDVVPGIALELHVDQARVADAGVDASSLRIYTRPDAGEPWVELPSYFDAESGTVKGESDHLSQFVVIGVPFVVPAGPRVVLDPDNDDGYADTPAPRVTEFPFNWGLVDGLRSMLETRCHAMVTVTRPAGVPFVSRETRAGVAAAADPVATVSFGFATFQGDAWGSPSDGGTMVFSRGGGADDALGGQFVGSMPAYTTRPSKWVPANPTFPFTDFAGLPGAYVHVETLFMDHNYDRPVIDNGFGSVVNGSFRSVGGYLESTGFDCTDPATGGWPSPPSQAEIERWRQLGYQNYQTYGADPVSFSTGNLVESVPTFTLPGVGDQVIDGTLVYNDQDGRLSRVGAGWSFGLGARAQRFSDGSVMTVRGDGASFVFTPDGAGGYTAEPGTGLALTEAGGGQLRLSNTDGEVWVFDAADVDGIGELVSHTDTQGATLSFTYGGASPDLNQFVPLTAITDSAGQTVTVSNDAVGRVTGFALPDGRTWQLAYDGAGNLTSVTDANGGVRSFTYDDGHRMLSATDPEGVLYLVNEYDADGRVVKQLDADSNMRTFAYGDGQTTYVDNEGKSTLFAFDAQHRITGITNPAGETASWVFDTRGNVSSHTDEAGRRWAYTYDGNDRLTTETDPAGAVTTYTYTPAGRTASVTDALGRTTGYSYDAQGLVTAVDQADGTTLTYTYTGTGDLATATTPSGATTTHGYDGHGNLTSLTDPIGRATTYGYAVAIGSPP